MIPGTSRAALLAALLVVALGPRPGSAQATLRGRVIDSEFGQGLSAAVIRIRLGPAPATADSLGKFTLAGLTTGLKEVTVEVLGYSTGVFMIYLPDTGTVNGLFPLDFTGHDLPPVVVEARAERLIPRYMDFERRRQRKLGAYLRWDDLEKQAYTRVADALRTVRGVRVQCNQQTFECFAFMVRSPQCQPTWWIDGVEVRSFHENTPIRDIYGIEIYRGAGEIPGEFSGSDAACGVIVVWTKSRPYRADP
jgi:hypothetical protein